MAEVKVDLAFKRSRIPVGAQWISIACSGAWLRLKTTAGSFLDATTCAGRMGQHAIRQNSSSAVSAKLGALEGNFAQARDSEVSYQAEVQESLSTSVSADRREVAWTFELDRSAQPVRDCLDGNKELFASLGSGDSPGELVLRAAPVDCRVFDARNRALTVLASIAVAVKLGTLGIARNPKVRTLTIAIPALRDEAG